MLFFSRWKLITIFLLCLCTFAFAAPNVIPDKLRNALPSWLPSQTVHLGLDLRGGSQLLLRVDFDSYIAEQLDSARDSIRKKLRSNKIGYTGLKKLKNSIELSLRDPGEMDKAKSLIKRLSADFSVDNTGSRIKIDFSDTRLTTIKDNLLDQSIEIIRRRVDETGTTEPSIQRQGDNDILLQVPGLSDPDHLKNLLGKTAKLTFHMVNQNAASYDRAPSGSMILKGEKGEDPLFVIYKKIILTGDLLEDARASFSDGTRPVVSFKFNSLGARRFGEITKKNSGKLLAIVLDNKVISAPRINEPILGGSGVITGNFTVRSANDLALLLRAGALPAPLKIIEERTVGPSLGLDSIEAGKVASVVGIIAVMVFMVIVYGLFGMFANIALFFNMVFIIGTLSLLQATLTMPGIAAIVLTIGMAVDANVLIFERIREESRIGLSSFATIERGFKHAFATILDSNLTTVIAGILLYIFGSGAVKGFAITLIIGIIASMFSAITLTRLMIVTWLKLKRPSKIIT